MSRSAWQKNILVPIENLHQARREAGRRLPGFLVFLGKPGPMITVCLSIIGIRVCWHEA